MNKLTSAQSQEKLINRLFHLKYFKPTDRG